MAKKFKVDSRGRIIPSGGFIPPACRDFPRKKGIRVDRRVQQAIDIVSIHSYAFTNSYNGAFKILWRKFLSGELSRKRLFDLVAKCDYVWDVKKDEWVHPRFEAAMRDSVKDLAAGWF